MPARPRPLTPDRSARHLFGAKMRTYRGSMSLERLAEIVNFSKSHLARVETAESMPPPELPALLDAAFDTDGIFVELYRVARREIHPDQFRRRMEIEAKARVIADYTGQLMPGLAQTEEYARLLFRTYDPRATDATVEDLLAARMSRQARLRDDDAPDYSVVIDEAVLCRGFGGPSVMRPQLARLIELNETTNCVMQVLPFSHGGHALMGGSLALFTLGDGTQVAWEEGHASGTLLEDFDSVVTRRHAYDLLRSCALSPTESSAFVRNAMEALPDEHRP